MQNPVSSIFSSKITFHLTNILKFKKVELYFNGKNIVFARKWLHMVHIVDVAQDGISKSIHE